MKEKKQGIFRDYEREPVPQEIRRNWLEMGLVWIGVGMCLAALMLGGVVGAGLNLKQAAGAILVGGAVLTIINALCSVVGARTNLSTAMVGRFAFGDWGVYVVAAVLALGCYGWFAVQLGLFGETAVASVKMITGNTANTSVMIAGGGVLMLLTAIFGYRGIARLSIVAVPAMAILIILSLRVVLIEHPFGELLASPPPGQPMPFGMAASIIAGSYMVGAVIGPDVCRYAKNAKHAVGAAIIGFFVGFSLMVYAGSILAQAAGEWDVVKIMIGLGWGLIAMVVLILAQWTTNDNNLYSAALNFSVIFRRSPKWQLTIIAGIIGIILALWGIYGRFVSWLIILSVTIPPIGGVYVADYFAFHKEFYSFNNLDKVPKWRPLMLLAWIAGSLVGFATTAPPTGFGWFKLSTVPAIDAFIVGVVVQLLLVGIYRKTKGTWPKVAPM